MSEENAKGKLLQVFNFIKAYNELRNPVQTDVKEYRWLLWFHDLPQHSTIKLVECQNNDDNNLASQVAEEVILKVKRPVLTECPAPPQEIEIWLKGRWKDIDGTVELQNSIEMTDENGNKTIVEISIDDKMQRIFEDWMDKRNNWIIKEVPARRAMDIFKKLYKLYSEIQRESETLELILGDGMLSWSSNAFSSIYHPVLLQKVELKFNSDIPEFRICYSEYNTELNNSLFRPIKEINNAELAKCNIEFEKNNYGLFDKLETDKFLQRVVLALSPEGEFYNNLPQTNKGNKPYIYRDPVLFLRKRNQGFSIAIDSVIDDISKEGNIPTFMKSIVGISDTVINETDNKGSESTGNPNGEDRDILFTKPANSEQLLAAKQLQRNGAVLIQGPPGTGKTHTIANLVGHLLSEGKSVLITSYSEKALKVLRDKIVEPLKPLCLPVLSSTESRKEMEKTLDAMDERQSGTNGPQLKREINELTERRESIIDRLNKKREELKRERLNEYRNIVVGGNEYSPINAAKYVADNSENDSWIPSPVMLDSICPVSQDQIKNLYRTNIVMTTADEKESMLHLPNIENIPNPDEFEKLINSYNRLKESKLDYGLELWDMGKSQEISVLENILYRITDGIKVIIEDNNWELEIIEAGYPGRKERENWEKLIEEINIAYEKYIDFKGVFIEFNPQISDTLAHDESISVINEIEQYLSMKVKINAIKLLTKPKWKEVIEASRVNNKKPEKIEEFKSIKQYIELLVIRQKLKLRWHRQIEVLDGPQFNDFKGDVEEICKFYCENIINRLKWYETVWLPLEREIKNLGFNFESFIASKDLLFPKHNELLTIKKKVTEELPDIINAQVNRLAVKEIECKFTNLLDFMKNFKEGQVNKDLQSAVELHSPMKYKSAFDRIIQLYKFREKTNFRNEVLSKIEIYAPQWAYQIGLRQGIHGNENVPGDCSKAWLWRQLNDELDRRSRVSIPDIQQEIAALEKELRKITGNLVSSKAWDKKLSSLTHKQTQAINGWRLTMKRIGGGTGRMVPTLLAEARRLMPTCQSAVPVWIMPISRVVENFNPKENKFDVVIIDEASQADIMALPVLYMAKQVVIVGDDEQVSPVDIGSRIDEIMKLIDTYLDGIPNKQLYTGKLSIYDIAKTSGYQPVCLREHFRCVSPIIQFSNRLSYDWKIKPLRDESTVTCKPPLVPFRVENAVQNGKVNEEEGKVIASLIQACIEQQEYKGKTFGVISMVGEEQANYVETLLQRYIPPADYMHRKIQCGNSPHFQGDERDIVFISLVDTPSGNGPLSLRRDGPDDMYKKRYNVAASRACDQMWVVYSLNPQLDLKDGDLRLELIKHAKDPYAVEREIESKSKEADSEFEKLVISRLIRVGYKVTPQWKVGAYKIDIVVEGGGKRLAIECDGEKYHTLENLDEDMQRQAILERLGWKFVRIRGSQFFRDADEAMIPVFTKLEQLEIPPEGNKIEDSIASSCDNELIERVKRRAEEIRRQWEEGEDTEVDMPKLMQISSAVGQQKKVHEKINKTEESIYKDENINIKNNKVEVNVTSQNVQKNNTSTQISTQTIKNEKLPGLKQNKNVIVKTDERQIGIFDTLIKDGKAPDLIKHSNNEKVEIAKLLKEKGITCIDKRPSGGCLWVVGSSEVDKIIKKLIEMGLDFKYSEKGGKATKHQPSWYLKD